MCHCNKLETQMNLTVGAVVSAAALLVEPAIAACITARSSVLQ